MLSYKTLEPHTLELLKKLTQEPFLSKSRLVGGTALALQYGHRICILYNIEYLISRLSIPQNTTYQTL